MNPWAQIGAAFVGSLSAATGPARALVDQIAQWGTHLASNAAQKWIVRVTTDPRPCHMRGCKGKAVVPCVSCGEPTCMTHAYLSFEAEGICFACATGVQVGDVPAEVSQAFTLFGIDEDAGLEEVSARYKKLVAKHHPDKQKGSVPKKRAEAFMKELNQAYAVLKKHFEERKAA